jgi:hypothetical protein
MLLEAGGFRSPNGANVPTILCRFPRGYQVLDQLPVALIVFYDCL